jgi:hypothetical protein
MFAITPSADIGQELSHVRLEPKADIWRRKAHVRGGSVADFVLTSRTSLAATGRFRSAALKK